MPAGFDRAQFECSALIWTDIGPYHATRSRVAFETTPFSVGTIEILGASSFEEFRAGEAEASTFPRHTIGLTPPLRASAARRPMHDVLSRLAPDVVFTPGWAMPESLVAIDWCVANRLPFVVMSDSTREDHPRTPAKEAIKQRILSLAAAALVAGGPQADYAAELGMPRERIFLGYDVVDNDHFMAGADRAREQADALRARHHLPERYFFCCARLIEKKNVPRLVEAFAAYRVQARNTPWHLVIAGPGPLQAAIEARIAALGLGDVVRLVGAQGYPVLPHFYGLAGAFILASTMDQWGLVVNEAMASGLPVLVSSRCGCARDLVQDGRNGFTFDPFDIAAMADAMTRIASDDCDRAAMGAASRKIIADWGPARFAAGFEAAAKAALAAPRRAPSLVDRMLLRALTLR